MTELIETQLDRVLLQLKDKPTDLERFIHLMNLLETNQTLFYRTLMSDPARFLEIVYDPTIGEACLKFDHIFRRPLGMYLSISRKGHVKEVLRNWPVKDVRFICVTNAGRILGLGDLGANGMGIPIGKLQLYTAAAGVPPEGLLPMYLDSGTNNETYLRDPLYVGLRQHRPSTEELYAFVDEFVEAVQEVFPNCCIHFEDWTGTDAIALLARYRNKVCCYNDDIQGTAGVTLAGLINALKLTGGQLKEQRVLFLGAGSAAIGLADLIVSAHGSAGRRARGGPAADPHVRYPRAGGCGASRPCRTQAALRAQAAAQQTLRSSRPGERVPADRRGHRGFQADRPDRRQHRGQTVLAGGRRGDVAPQRAADHLCPVEPDRKTRMPARAGLRLVRGQGIYAGGVQFPPVHFAGQTFLPSQANNLYIFPAVGMAIYATNAKRVTDEMFIEAAHAVADQVTPEQLKLGMLFPPQSNILEVEIQTAARVAKLVFDAGLARVDRPANIEAFIRRHLYKPEYQTLA